MITETCILTGDDIERYNGLAMTSQYASKITGLQYCRSIEDIERKTIETKNYTPQQKIKIARAVLKESLNRLVDPTTPNDNMVKLDDEFIKRALSSAELTYNEIITESLALIDKYTYDKFSFGGRNFYGGPDRFIISKEEHRNSMSDYNSHIPQYGGIMIKNYEGHFITYLGITPLNYQSIVDYLQGKEYIKIYPANKTAHKINSPTSTTSTISSFPEDFIANTIEGQLYLEENLKKVRQSSQAFVAMWFGGNDMSDEMRDLYNELIKPAIEACGYEAYRIDFDNHNERIIDKIYGEIENSKFVVADLSHGDEGARGGVYFEAGYAEGLKTPVFYTCGKQSFEEYQVHFDKSTDNILMWDDGSKRDVLDGEVDNSSFKQNLASRIYRYCGAGPNFDERKYDMFVQ